MFCANCGSPVPDGSQFCPKCGGRQTAASPPAAAPSPGAAPVTHSPHPKKANKKAVIAVCAAVGVVALVNLLVSLLTGGGSGKNAGGYDTPEEAAIAFVQAAVEADEELFKTCVHPIMLEEWTDIFIFPDDISDVTEISARGTSDVPGDEVLDAREKWLDEFGIALTDAKVVTVAVKYYDYNHGEERSSVRETGVFCVDGRWYAWGWS